VKEVDVISGHSLLVPIAVEEVKCWKYEPYKKNGRTIEVETNITINFTIEKPSAN
jgi:outer membrane biosynthesis protein TonB